MIFYIVSFLKKLVKNDTRVIIFRRGSWVVLSKESGNITVE